GNWIAEAMLPGARRGRRFGDRRLPDSGRRRMPAIDDILVEYVDFPERPIGIGDPEFGLQRVTALDAFLTLGVQAGRFEAPLNLDELIGVANAQADVVQMPPGAGTTRYQRQHERWFGQLELCVVRAGLRGLGSEEDAVERNRSIQIGHVERRVELAEARVNGTRHRCTFPSGAGFKKKRYGAWAPAARAPTRQAGIRRAPAPRAPACRSR